MNALRFLVVCLLAALAVRSAYAGNIEQIDVQFTWGGHVAFYKETIRIQRTANGAYTVAGESSGEDNGKPRWVGKFQATPLAPHLVDRFERTLADPPWSTTDLLARFATPEWLKPHAVRFYEKRQRCSPEARGLFYRSLDAAHIRAALIPPPGTIITIGSRNDDYPSASVAIHFKGGRTLKLSSHSWKGLMLPWQIDGVTTMSPFVPRTLQDLLPKTSGLSQRINEEKFAEEFYDSIMDQIEDEWENLEMRCEHRGLLQIIEPKFQAVSLYQSNNCLCGYFRRADLPPNLVINVVIDSRPAEKGRLEAQQFLQKIDSYLTLALPFVRAHPEIKFSLWYANGRSVDASSLLAADDKLLARQIAPFSEQAVLLRAQEKWGGGREWVVLPNGTVHLLRDGR